MKTRTIRCFTAEQLTAANQKLNTNEYNLFTQEEIDRTLDSDLAFINSNQKIANFLSVKQKINLTFEQGYNDAILNKGCEKNFASEDENRYYEGIAATEEYVSGYFKGQKDWKQTEH